ncbi:MAG: hypothetical protein KME16_25725 [Scytolyngbya sp. HA4215-MV1]|nr:hypothetical protein [Scytolyngbya sp. HA4215-MV1]
MEFSFAPVPDASTPFLQQFFFSSQPPAVANQTSTKANNLVEQRHGINYRLGAIHCHASSNSSELETLMRFI